MKTETITLYSYDELSDKAKDVARDWFLSDSHDDFSEAIDSLHAFEKVFPIKVKDWNYGWGGQWVSFSFLGNDDIVTLCGWRLATYIWNNYRNDIYKGKYFSTKMSWIDGKCHYKYRHSKIILESGSCPFTGTCYDEDLLDPLWKFLESPSNSMCFSDLMHDCLYSWIKSIDNEADSHTEEEYIAETCEANDYNFLASGKFWS